MMAKIDGIALLSVLVVSSLIDLRTEAVTATAAGLTPTLITTVSDVSYYVHLDNTGLPYKNTGDGAVNECAKNGKELWQLNPHENVPANNTLARSVLDSLRAFPAVSERIRSDQVLNRLNIIYGKSYARGWCKLYLAGPFSDQSTLSDDFYTFTYQSNECTGADSYHWYICEDGKTTTIEPTTTEATTITAESSTTTIMVSTTEGESSSTTTAATTTSTTVMTTVFPTEPAVVTTTQSTADEIKDFIDKADDVDELVDGVTKIVQDSKEHPRDVKQWQDELFNKVETLVKDNATAAMNTTRHIFRETVNELLKRVADPEDFGAILGFIGNISTRVAVHMDDTEIKVTNSSSTNYRIKKTRRSSSSISSIVLRSAVNVSGLPEVPDSETIVTHVEFVNPDLSKVFPKERRFATGIVEFFVLNNGTKIGKSGVDVLLTFDRTEESRDHEGDEFQCVFYDRDSRQLSDYGCKRVAVDDSRIQCRCNHTTSFASVFLSDQFPESFEMILTITTYALTPFSVIALITCIYVFGFIRHVRSLLTTIHFHLCITVLVCQLLLVICSIAYGFGSNSIPADDGIISKGSSASSCSMVAGVVVHYVFLTSISWMALEGFHSCYIMLRVFNKPIGHGKWYLLVGYGVPLVFPILAIAIFQDEAYVQAHQLCFLNRDSAAYWLFLAPLLSALTVNVSALSLVVYRLRTVNRGKGLSSSSNAVSGAAPRTTRAELIRYGRGVLCMSVLLGLQWIFGTVLYVLDTASAPAVFTCALFFVVLCMLQGPMIFLLHIATVKSTRHAIARFLADKGSFCRKLANWIRPPPPRDSTSGRRTGSSQQGTRSTGLSSEENNNGSHSHNSGNHKGKLSSPRSHSPTAPPLELNRVDSRTDKHP